MKLLNTVFPCCRKKLQVVEREEIKLVVAKEVVRKVAKKVRLCDTV
jgi:hypothetical protein